MNILYVEKDQDLSENIKNKLKSHYNVDVANTGEDGVLKTENKEYDLMILNYHLPDMDGIQVCRRVREMDIKTPILIFTTNEKKETKVDYRRRLY